MCSTPFLVAANVGLFYKLRGDPIVPDVLLSLRVQRPSDFSQWQNRSYFVWEFGKVPEVCIEIVSNQEGKTTVKEIYAQMGIRYYVVFDPLSSGPDAAGKYPGMTIAESQKSLSICRSSEAISGRIFVKRSELLNTCNPKCLLLPNQSIFDSSWVSE